MRVRALIAAAALAGWVHAADPPRQSAPPSGGTSVRVPPSEYRSVGTVTGKVSKVSATTVTLSLPEVELKGGTSSRSRPRVNIKHKDHDYDLAGDVKVRFGFAPKRPDGKTTPPDGLPGYRAESSDLKAGQVVRLYLGKKAPPGSKLSDLPTVVTMVMIEVEAPPPKADKAKK